ncbi:hypothetical protein AGMMS49992_24500 [Clostridia bacterium]|nr:hypothetical protein AGMMS49992_24500 [Clostridia bacterium]
MAVATRLRQFAAWMLADVMRRRAVPALAAVGMGMPVTQFAALVALAVLIMARNRRAWRWAVA